MTNTTPADEVIETDVLLGWVKPRARQKVLLDAADGAGGRALAGRSC